MLGAMQQASLNHCNLNCIFKASGAHVWLVMKFFSWGKKGFPSHRNPVTKLFLLFVLKIQRVGTGALLLRISSKFYDSTYSRRCFKNADVCDRLMCTGFSVQKCICRRHMYLNSFWYNLSKAQSQLRTSFPDHWTVIKCTVAVMHLDTQVTLLDRCCITSGVQVG